MKDIELESLTGSALVTAGNYGDVVFSNDNKFLAVPFSSSPFLKIFKRTGDNLDAQTLNGTIPNYGLSADFSPDGQFLAVGHSNTPYLSIFKVDSSGVWQKLGNPSVLPGNASNSVSFSPDGNYLVVAASGTPAILIYKRSGDVFTKLTISDSSGSSGKTVRFSPDGQFLAFSFSSAPYLKVFKKVGDDFINTNLSFNLGQSIDDVIFSPDGKYMVHTGNGTTTPRIVVYKILGDGFSVINGLGFDSARVQSLSFTSDSKIMASGGDGTVYFYLVDGGQFKKLGKILTQTGNRAMVDFSPDSKNFALLSSTTSPYFKYYKMSYVYNNNYLFKTEAGSYSGFELKENEAVSASSTFISSVGMDFSPVNAINGLILTDNSSGSRWSNVETDKDVWFEVKFQRKLVNKIKILQYIHGTNYDRIKSCRISFSNGEMKEFSVSSTGATYNGVVSDSSWITLEFPEIETTSIKLEVLSRYTGSYSYISFIAFDVYSSDEKVEIGIPKLIVLDSLPKEKDYIDYGSNAGESIDLDMNIANKEYVVSETGNLDSGKIFKQKIDTSKTKIINVSIK